ncbi:MAG TPA: hypothetical protein VG186_15390 [Solirubrobacteraceae bacterium]|nr:hypothetical protein [Solirubrobacteraceae bacterium]
MDATLPAPPGAPNSAANADNPAPAPVSAAPRRAAAARRGETLALGAIALALLVVAFVPFVTTAIDAARHHRVFLGATGQYPMDALQYLSWVSDAHNGLIRNLFGSAHDRALFVHPMWSPAGWIQAATGVGDAAIIAFWTVVAGAVLFAGVVRLAWRYIPSELPWRRPAAVLVAVFGGLTPVALYLQRSDRFFDLARAGGDLVPVASLWEYSPLVIALGLMPFAIEGVERLLAGEGRRRTAAATAVLGLGITWLHPWQGATFIVVVIGLVLWRRYDREQGSPRLPALVVVAAATALPLGYYLVLSRVDPGWAVSERTSVAARIPWQEVAGGLVPLALIGAVAARRVIHDRAARGLVLWAAATLVVAGVSPSGQSRAIAGVAIPVGVLAVKAWPTARRSPRRMIAAAAALLALLAPTAVFVIDLFGSLRPPSVAVDEELNPSDVRAARFAATLAGPEPILSTPELGTAIPALTDKPTWVGHPVWTPNTVARWIAATSLFSGSMTTQHARAFVTSTAARVLVEPCASSVRLEPALAPLGFRELTFGCAHVYTRAKT